MSKCRYVALKTFVGFDGLHRKGELLYRKRGAPIDAWISRGLIAEVPDPVPTEKTIQQPAEVPVKKPDQVETPGPSQTKAVVDEPANESAEPSALEAAPQPIDEAAGIQIAYRCGDCDAVFSSRAALNGHMSAHKRKGKD